MQRSRVLSVSLRPELVEMLRDEAERQDRPVSRLVGEAVRYWAEKKIWAEDG